ncbi:MAG: hypothetical protein WCB46_05525 [Methanoregula sp.]
MKPLRVSLDFLEFPRLHTCDGENLLPVIRPEGRSAASVTIMVFNPFGKSPVRSYQGSAGPSADASHPCRHPPQGCHHRALHCGTGNT